MILSQDEIIMETPNINETTQPEIEGEGEFEEEDLVEDIYHKMMSKSTKNHQIFVDSSTISIVFTVFS